MADVAVAASLFDFLVMVARTSDPSKGILPSI